MGLPASGVDVGVIADIPAANLQSVLGTIYGKSVYAANGVGEAIYKADQANGRLDVVEGSLSTAASVAFSANYKIDALVPRVDAVEGVAADASATAYSAKGTADYVAGLAGFLDFHLREIAAIVSYPIPPYS